MDQRRRNLLCGLGGLAFGVAITAGPAYAQTVVEAPKGRFDQVGGLFGWQPHPLDVAECQPVAYDGYWYKGLACGYGSFYSIIGMLGEKYGPPYNQFPFSMLEANKGGISDWGTICGALYGAAAAFALFWGRDERTPMVNELFRWYEQTALPIYNPGDAAKGVKGDLPVSIANSPLCHISVSKWCYDHNIEATSKERNERCGRLTADVSKKAIEIFNRKIDEGKGFQSAIGKQKSVKYCGACHETKGKPANWAKGTLNCAPCHSGGDAVSNKYKNHPTRGDSFNNPG